MISKPFSKILSVIFTLAGTVSVVTWSCLKADQLLTAFIVPPKKEKVRITSISGFVGRREADDWRWDVLRRGDDVYSDDQVYTERTGHLALQFSPTLQIRLEADSSLKLSETFRTAGPSHRRIGLSLESGAVQVEMDRRDRLTLGLAQRRHTVSCPTNARFYVYSSEHHFTIEVLSGSIEVAGGRIAKNQKAEFAANGKFLRVEKRTIELTFPSQNQKLWRLGGALVDFHWQPTVRRDYTLLVSDEPFFSRPFLKMHVENRESAAIRLPAAGKYYWRVEDRFQKALRSAAYDFEVFEELQPAATYPPHLAHFRIDSGKNEGDMTFTFKPGSVRDDIYLLEIANTENFAGPVMRKKIKGLHAQHVSLPAGSYYWRVKADGEQRTQALWSRPRKLVILSHDEPLTAPHLLTAQVKKFQQDSIEKNEAHIAFDRVFGADSYRIEVKVNDDPEPRIFTQKSPTFLLTDPTPGIHLIRAQALHPELLNSPWSQTAIAVIEGRSKTAIESQN